MYRLNRAKAQAQVAESMNSMSEGINEVVSSVSDCHTSAAEIDQQLTHVTEKVNEMKNVAEGVSKDSKTGQEPCRRNIAADPDD